MGKNQKNKRSNVSKILLAILTIGFIFACAFLSIRMYQWIKTEFLDEEVGSMELNPFDLEETNTISKTEIGNAENPYSKVQQGQEVVQNTYTENQYYYMQLDDTGKVVYNGINQSIEQMKSGTHTVDYKRSFDSLLKQQGGEEKLGKAFQSAWDAFLLDHPEVFYIDASRVNLSIISITRGNSVHYEVTMGPKEGASYLADGFTSEDQVNQAISQIEGMRNEIIGKIQRKDTYSQILAVHDYLVDSLEYDISLQKPNIYNIYGSFINKTVVCEGYAKSFKYLLDGLKIPCIIVSGNATDSDGKSESHAWNYVRLEQNWYGTDTTWDDPIIEGGGKLTKQMRYKYFLKGSGAFAKSHTPDGNISGAGMIFEYPTLSNTNYKP